MAEYTDKNVEQVLKNLRYGIAAGVDGILQEFIKI